MRWTQSKELNQNPEVTGSNPVKYKKKYMYIFIDFSIHYYYFFSLGLCLTSLSTFFLVIQLPSTVLLHMLL